MTKRQKVFIGTTFILGFIYLILSNYFILQLGNIFKEDNIILYLITYLLSIGVMFVHAIIYGSWISSFVSNMVESDKFFYKFKERNFFNNKFLLRLKAYINKSNE